MKRKTTLIALTAATVLGFGAAAHARPGCDGPGMDAGYGAGMHQGMGPGGHHGGMHGFGRGEHVEGMLAFLKTEIGIQGDQEKAWKQFADAIRTQTEARKTHHEAMREARGEMRDADAVKRGERHIAKMEFRISQAKAHLAALKELYPTLTPEQKQKADKLLPGGKRRFHRGMGQGDGPGMQGGNPPMPG
ncbi:MAG: Spy/CpxP family protein refolding chaperone [Gammaproteobacteria bacterium]|jgi:hypothetical protein|nr:Spy/CpxP family protein refolding chaperone [Gammaproteobacteria bacterium]